MTGSQSPSGTKQQRGVVYRKGGKKLSAFPYPGGKTSYVDEIIRGRSQPTEVPES
jgi:hypothetical protein